MQPSPPKFVYRPWSAVNWCYCELSGNCGGVCAGDRGVLVWTWTIRECLHNLLCRYRIGVPYVILREIYAMGLLSICQCMLHENDSLWSLVTLLISGFLLYYDSCGLDLWILQLKHDDVS